MDRIRLRSARSSLGTLVFLGAALLACKQGEDGAAKGESASVSSVKRLDHPGTEAGLTALLTANFASGTAKPADVVARLKPDPADYAAVFEGDAADKVAAHTSTMFREPPPTLGKDGDSVQVFAVTASDLASGGGAAERCPGGYGRIASKLKSGTTIHCAKVGSVSYDAFVHVNGHWVWFPKPFRALRE
jgi:hypothetical protein